MSMRVKCLVVDDREANVLAMSKLLEGEGVEVIAARSGAEALELLLVHDVALALLDVQMPEMDGFELAELMRGSERTRHVPIIFVTAGAHEQRRVFAGYDLGAVDFLFKPIEPHILKNKAQVFFELHRHRQRLAQELQARTETLRLAEMFTAILGHDLRNPLHVVLSGARLLALRGENEATRRIASRMEASATRMSRLVTDMLDLARVRLAGGIPVRRSRLDLQPVVERVIEEYRAAQPEGRIEYRSVGDTCGEWDGERLGQVVANLIGNALQHGQEESAVAVTLDGRSEDRVDLEVSNAGGIPPDRLAVLFDPFSSRSRPRGPNDGLGLGLYIVEQSVKAHGGVVHVSSRDDRTTFRVTLPRWEVATARVAVP